MPNYTGFELQRPFSSLIGGMGAANEMQYSALRSEATRAAIDQQKEQRAATKEYAATGEDTVLKGVAPDLWMKLDDQQRKSVESGMKDFREIAPYLTSENYGPMREKFARRNPNLADLWPTADQMTDPNNLRTFVTRAANLGAQIEAQRIETLAPAQVGAQKQQMEAITIPTLKLQQQQQVKMAGIQYDNQKSLQENAQQFQGEQYGLNRTVQRDLATMTDARAKADHLYNNLRTEEHGVDQLYFKGMEAIDKEYGGSTDDPGYIARVKKLNADRAALRSEIQNKYSDWAKQADIPYKPGQLAPPAEKSIFKSDAEKSAAQASFEKHMSITPDLATRKRYLEGAAKMGLDTSKFK